MPSTTEAAFTSEVMKWAKAYGWLSFHVRNSGYAGNSFVQGDKGFCDLILVRGVRWIAAELKVQKAGTKLGDPKPEQLRWLNALRMVGAETFVWRPEDWNRILVVLSGR